MRLCKCDTWLCHSEVWYLVPPWVWLANATKYQATKEGNCQNQAKKELDRVRYRNRPKQLMWYITFSWIAGETEHQQKNKAVWYRSLIELSVCTHDKENHRRCDKGTAQKRYVTQEGWLAPVWYQHSTFQKWLQMTYSPLFYFNTLVVKLYFIFIHKLSIVF